MWDLFKLTFSVNTQVTGSQSEVELSHDQTLAELLFLRLL